MDESDIRKERNKEVAASLDDHPKRQTKRNKHETFTFLDIRKKIYRINKLEVG